MADPYPPSCRRPSSSARPCAGPQVHSPGGDVLTFSRSICSLSWVHVSQAGERSENAPAPASDLTPHSEFAGPQRHQSFMGLLDELVAHDQELAAVVVLGLVPSRRRHALPVTKNPCPGLVQKCLCSSRRAKERDATTLISRPWADISWQEDLPGLDMASWVRSAHTFRSHSQSPTQPLHVRADLTWPGAYCRHAILNPASTVAVCPLQLRQRLSTLMTWKQTRQRRAQSRGGGAI